MYMGPIVAAKPASPLLLRRAVGAPVLLLSALVMLPWLAVNAAVMLVGNAGPLLRSALDALIDMVDYAGKVTLGR